MSVLSKSSGYQTKHNEAKNKASKVQRENLKMRSYYNNALNQRNQEIIYLKQRVNQLLTSLEVNKKAYNKLKTDYSEYRKQSLKVLEKESNKIYNAYRIEQQKNLLLEEKIRVLEATIEHFKSE